MATLLLSTSCTPLKRSSTPSSHGGNSDAVDHRSSATSDYWSNVGSSDDGKNGCGTTEQSAADLDTTSLLLDSHSCHHHDLSLPSIVNSNPQAKNSGGSRHVENGPQQGTGQGVELLFDKLRALPVQCDITIVPRAHPTDLSANSSSLNSNANNDSSIGGGGDEGGVMQPVRITKQHFHPCGMDNIVRLATGSSSVTSFDFILSLANCGVRVGNGEELMKLPVQAVPSSFSIPSSHNVEEGYDSMGQYVHGDKPYSYSRGAKRNVEEVAVSFDFSMAVNVYQQRLDEISAAERLNHSKLVHDARVKKNPSWNADGTTTTWKEQTAQDLSTANVVKNLEINSIMSTLEKESQFIKKTLFVLGSFGFGLLICMVWTIYKLERGRRARRRVHVRRVLVDNVPCEIIGTTTANDTTMTNNTAATTKSRGPGVTSSLQSHPSSLLRSNNDNGKAHHFPEEISPIRSSSVSLDEAEEEEVEQVDDVVAVTVSETKKKKAVHETLHLITPHDVVTVTGSRSSNTDEGQRSSSSPRHWYEDFLSPKGCSKKAPRSNGTDDDAVLSEHEEVARSLFRSSSSSSSDCNKVTPSMDNKDSYDNSKGTSSSSILNAPKKKVLVAPIESSSLMSPPPSDTSLLKLSKDIESMKSPLMISIETEGAHESCTATGRELDEEPQTNIEDIDKDEHYIISPTSVASNEESSSTSMDATSTAAKDESTETIKPSLTPINTPKPKSSRTLKTPATDISIGSSSQESSQASAASLRARKIFAQELTKKAWLTPPNTQKTNFSTSIARRAAEVQTSKKTLTPLSASSSLCGDDEPSPFLADYW